MQNISPENFLPFMTSMTKFTQCQYPWYFAWF